MIPLTRAAVRIGGSRYEQMKDPCPVFHQGGWHLYGTGVLGPHRFEVLHATARRLEGPWRLRKPIATGDLTGRCVGAPGVIAAEDGLHMFLQTEYDRFGGTVEHLVSRDGTSFERAGTALCSLPGTPEAGIYDAHPALVRGVPHLVYSAFSVVGEPDVHLARSQSGSWAGPWRRLGAILRHEHVACHNQRNSAGYEWGLEGAQLLELPGGDLLLNVVCFVPGHPPACRQRVVLARAADPCGPYEVGGAAVVPLGGDLLGENGHGTLVLDGDRMALFFQERYVGGRPWHYGLATAPLAALLAASPRSAA